MENKIITPTHTKGNLELVSVVKNYNKATIRVKGNPFDIVANLEFHEGHDAEANTQRIVKAVNALNRIEKEIEFLEREKESLPYRHAAFLADLKQLLQQAEQK